MGYAGRHHTSESVLPNKFLKLVSVLALLLLMLLAADIPLLSFGVI
jgi:hypothetical protein